MIYRVTIDLAFPDSKSAGKAIQSAKELFPYSVVINKGKDNQETGIIQVTECYHDEEPTKPCVVVFQMSNAPTKA